MCLLQDTYGFLRTHMTLFNCESSLPSLKTDLDISFSFRPPHAAYGVFVPHPGIEPTPPPLGVRILNR